MTITYLHKLVVEKVKNVCSYKKQCTLCAFDVNHNHITSHYIMWTPISLSQVSVCGGWGQL